MASSKTTLKSPRANRYLQQMCKHFGHKIPVTFTRLEGRIEFPFGTCLMTAEDDALSVIVEGKNADIAKLEKVIGDHLARFAFRENPALIWHQKA